MPMLHTVRTAPLPSIPTLATRYRAIGALSALLALSACAAPKAREGNRGSTQTDTRASGSVLTVRDTTIPTTLAVAGIAEALRTATVSTKWMGTVTEVLVQEGDAVQAGQLLVRLDARELVARSTQAAAGVAAAEAQQQDALAQAVRMRALFRDSAASRVQLEAAETGLLRASAALQAARAATTEVEAVSSYATIRAPFAGTVTQRGVDPGTMAAPGAPLVMLQDASRLRLVVSAEAQAVRTLRRGLRLRAEIDGAETSATIEGVVPGGAGNLFTVNALVENPGARFRAGSAATLRVPLGMHATVVVPSAAIVREGDLTGVLVRSKGQDERRWVRLGETVGTGVEITGGLQAGEQIVVPNALPTATAPAAPRGEAH